MRTGTRAAASLVAGWTFGALTALGVNTAYAASTWVTDHCDRSPSPTTPATWKRSSAESYADTANNDGYEWGGGCWNSDGVDNTPNETNENLFEGEGPDCSGFVFKTWKLARDQTVTGFRTWGKFDFIHGPWTAGDLKAGVGAAIVTISKDYATTQDMDGYASSTHTGMIYNEQSQGTDRIIEAKGDAYGTGKWDRDYRSDSNYGGIRRKDWTVECYPNCVP